MTLQEAIIKMKQLKCRRKCYYAFRKVCNKGVNGRANKLFINEFKYDK